MGSGERSKEKANKDHESQGGWGSGYVINKIFDTYSYMTSSEAVKTKS